MASSRAFMPQNRVMYFGIVLVVAAACVWLGAELTRRIDWAVPYIGGAGVALIVAGTALEVYKARRSS